VSEIDWPAVVAVVRELGLSIHLCPSWHDEELRTQERWSTFLIVPVEGYVESDCGPVAYRDIAWLDIRTRRETHRGRLIALLVEDMRLVLIERLHAIDIQFDAVQDDTHRLRIVGTGE
jgi:hypothetical protein